MSKVIIELRGYFKTQQAAVCAALDWSEMQYCTMQYNSGLHYVALYLAHDTCGVDTLLNSRLFWNWWKLQWSRRDQLFIEHLQRLPLELYSIPFRQNDYYAMHDATVLVRQLAPSRVVTEPLFYCRAAVREAQAIINQGLNR